MGEQEQLSAQRSQIKWMESMYSAAELKHFLKFPRHSGEIEFNIHQFHVEIKCILKLTSPNRIQRQCNNYSIQFMVRFLFLMLRATITLFEMLISKLRTPMWEKEK